MRTQCAHDMRYGTPTHVAARLHATDDHLVTPSQAEYRGLGQSSRMASNAHRLWRVHRGMPFSLGKTLAHTHRPSLHHIFHTYRATVATPHGPRTILAVRHERGKDPTPLIARFGGMALRWHWHRTRNDQPKAVFGHRSEVVQRLLA
jgi:hypothetical protein